MTAADAPAEDVRTADVPAADVPAVARPADDVHRTGAALALVALPAMRRDRLRALLDEWPDPRTVVARIRDGAVVAALHGLHPDPVGLGGRWAELLDVERTTRIAAQRGTKALLRTDPGYPMDVGQPTCPPLVLAEGDLTCFDRSRVAIVGTRAATPHGAVDAHALAVDLAEAGVTVISGMAIGVDGAAHVGALEAGGPTVGVIATGLDRCYPRRHVALHARVREQGALVTEQPFGTLPVAHRFPTRNHVIAALAHVVVLVEATIDGGAMITARAAQDIDVPVMVVPGSRRNPAAAGCNELLREGAVHALISADDVITQLGMTAAVRTRPSGPPPPGDHANVLAACAGEPATVDQLTARTGLSLADVVVAVDALVRGGHLRRERGWLWPMGWAT